MSTTTDERTYRITEADRPEGCPRWCGAGAHNLSDLPEGPFDEDDHTGWLRDFRTHHGVVGGGILFSHVQGCRVSEQHIRRDLDGSWNVYLRADRGLPGQADWLEDLVILEGTDENGGTSWLRLTAAEALLLARQLQVAAEALAFNRPVQS